MSAERRALPREMINLPALLSFDGIKGVHPCTVHDISAFGICLSTPYHMFASDFDLSFTGFHRTFACRVVWRRATLSGAVFVLRRCTPKSASVKCELASIVQFNRPNAFPLMGSSSPTCACPGGGVGPSAGIKAVADKSGAR
jgi:hypothetical protein